MKKTSILFTFLLALVFVFQACNNEEEETPTPVISGLVPTEFTLAAGASKTLTINGSNFGTDQSAVTVSLNGTNLSLQSVTDTRLQAVVTASNTGGTVTVTVNGKVATSSQSLTINQAPVISDFTPKSGGVGTEVTITGSNFNVDATVTFANDKRATVQFVSATELRVIVPEDAVTGKIMVSTSNVEVETATDFNVEFEIIYSITGKTWMARNLGASIVTAYGDLYQWGRVADGHQIRTSSTTSNLSSSDNPGHGDFILSTSSPYDWHNPQNNNLWQGVSGTNNPCPSGYRLPTAAEWNAERATWGSDDAAGAFGSPLKLPMAGRRDYFHGLLRDVGSGGFYWSSTVGSSTVDGTRAKLLWFFSSTAGIGSDIRAYGHSVRCIKD